MNEDRSNEDLMLAYQAGDTQAFDALYSRWAKRVEAYLSRRLFDGQEVDGLKKKRDLRASLH